MSYSDLICTDRVICLRMNVRVDKAEKVKRVPSTKKPSTDEFRRPHLTLGSKPG